MFRLCFIIDDPLAWPFLLTMRLVVLPNAKQAGAGVMSLVPLRIWFDIEISTRLPLHLDTHIYLIRI